MSLFKKTRLRITIEVLDEPKGPPLVLEGYDWLMTQEAGLHCTSNNEGDDYEHNGQFRVEMRGWKGCHSYEQFQALTVGSEQLNPLEVLRSLFKAKGGA